MKVKLIHFGKPIAKKRPRFAKKTGHAYNEQQTEEGLFLQTVRAQIAEQIDAPLKGPLTVVWEFVFPRPKGHYGTGRNAGKLKPSAPEWHVVKPDTSNLVKFPEDVLNHYLWEDDSQIVDSHETKRYVKYDEQPFTHLTVNYLQACQ